MNFDKESISEDFFLGGWGWGGGGGVGGVGRFPTKNKIQCLFAYFCAHALYKISSSWLK